MAIADSATIFGLAQPSADQDMLAGLQNTAAQLPAQASQLRQAAQAAADPSVAQAAGNIAGFADAAASGSPADMQAAAAATADFVQDHPELFTAGGSEAVGVARTLYHLWDDAIKLIGQANDPASTAAAIDATAKAFGQTAVLVSLVAAAFAGLGVGLAIGAIAAGLVFLANVVANLFRSDQPAQDAGRPRAPTAARDDGDPDDRPADQETSDQVTSRTGPDSPASTNRPTDRGPVSNAGEPQSGSSESGGGGADTSVTSVAGVSPYPGADSVLEKKPLF